MAEFAAAAGVCASIIQVIDACYKVKARVEAFTKDIAFKDVALQLELFAKDLEHIAQSDLPNQEHNANAAANDNPVLQRVLDGCKRQLDLLNQLLSEIIPDPASSRTHKTLQAVKTFGKDTKVRRLMQTLAEYRSTINLHLSTRIYAKDALVQSPSRSRFSFSLPQYKEIPNRRVSRFVGRQDLLSSIQNATNPDPNQPATVALTGLGGQGKTQTALEFCYKARDNYDIIFWINASSRKTAALDLSRLYDALGDSSSKADPETKARMAVRLLRNYDSSWLLVYDNYDRPDLFDITDFIPASKITPSAGSPCKILITSRSRECARLGNHHDLQGLTNNEAVELLSYRPGCAIDSDPDKATARQVVSRLGHLPLAIDQAGSYISTRGLSLSSFLDHYEQRRTAVMNHVPKCSWQYKTEASEAPPSAETLSVFTTWEMSAANISEDPQIRKSVLQFLTIAANFNGQRIDEELYRAQVPLSSVEASAHQWASQCVTDDQWDSYAYQDLVVGLASISLIQKFQFEQNAIWFTLHPLVQDWLQLRSSLEAQQQMLAHAISMTASIVHYNESQGFSIAKRRTYMQHVDSALSSVRYFLKTESAKVRYSGFVQGHQSIFATFYEENDRLDDAEKLFTEAYQLQLQYLGPSDLATLATQNNLANLYIKTGRLDIAEECLMAVIKTKESTIGLYDERTLNSVNNLGNLYNTQNKLSEAKYMYSRALTGYTALLGEKHRRTRAAASNLAEINVRMGNFDLAEQLFKRALEVEPQAAQGETSEICDALHYHVLFQLAEFKCKQGHMDSALKLLQETVEGRSRLFGESHSSTLAAMFRFDKLLYHIENTDKPPPYIGHGVPMQQSPENSRAFDEVQELEKMFEGLPQNGPSTGNSFMQPQEQAAPSSSPSQAGVAQQQNQQHPIPGTLTAPSYVHPQEQATEQSRRSSSYFQPQEQIPMNTARGMPQAQGAQKDGRMSHSPRGFVPISNMNRPRKISSQANFIVPQSQVPPNMAQAQQGARPTPPPSGFVQPQEHAQEHAPGDTCQPKRGYAQQQQQMPMAVYRGLHMTNYQPSDARQVLFGQTNGRQSVRVDNNE